jgi:hypothetical protein
MRRVPAVAAAAAQEICPPAVKDDWASSWIMKLEEK